MDKAEAPARNARVGLHLRLAAITSLSLFSATATHTRADSTPDHPLRFQISAGRVTNAFYQQGPIAAHLLLTSGDRPRLLVAFPAGNCGAGVWFAKTQTSVNWTLQTLEGTTTTDARGRALRGVIAHLTVDAPLIVSAAVLSSVRVLRDYQLTHNYPQEVRSVAKIDGSKVSWVRDRLDGAAGYALTIQIENGSIASDPSQHVTLSPSRADVPMRLTVTAVTGETPLTPFAATALLKARANDERSTNVLRFLAYEEKFLAGSWRFNTYFGRDTLMSLRLLLPVLAPAAVESGIRSVLVRLAPDGEVAHEEDIGEFAVLRHRKQGEPSNDRPIYDYKMIDDDFMLAPIAAAYLIEQSSGRERALAFLSATLPTGEKIGNALARNFGWVMQAAKPFAEHPNAANLVSLKPGIDVGDWRDSATGLGGGRYPFDVNVALVPAALDAIARFIQSGMLTPFLSVQQHALFSSASDMAATWSSEAPVLFRVKVANAEARKRITDYAGSIGVDATSALDALTKQDVIVNAIALDAQHHAIPILNSDGGFALLLQNPPAQEVDQFVASMLRPFPAGLLTDAGLLVANPVFAQKEQQGAFNRSAYHGTVVWSWQQALLAAALDRQLARGDLPEATKKRLRSARERLSTVIDNTRSMRSSELWSWRFSDGHYEPVPFGQSAGDADESNAAQLWSTVYLAVGPHSP